MSAACPQCGSPLPAKSPGGLCPRCLLLAGLQSEDRWQEEGPAEPEPAIRAEPASTIPSPQRRQGFQPPELDELARRFPQLEILELLGRGGMGAVYKARQRELDRVVALKILPPEVGSDPAFAQRFNREARALARLNHPNIVTVYDSGNAGGLYYFVMEYVDGVNLRQAIQSGRIAPPEALAIVPQICDALQYAHDEGIVHRDIKPENVLVDKRGRVKIADFGLAKLLASGDDSPEVAAHLATLTGAHQVMGTPRYMAPEQMEGSHTVDHRADIYSLGVVFYELLTGEVPMGRFDPPSKKVQVDVRLDEIVLRTLEREPARRYQRASEVKTDVQTVASSPAMPAAGAARPPADPPRRAPVASQAEIDLESARREVKVPATLLVVVGALYLVLCRMPLCGAGIWWLMPIGAEPKSELKEYRPEPDRIEERTTPPAEAPADRPAPAETSFMFRPAQLVTMAGKRAAVAALTADVNGLCPVAGAALLAQSSAAPRAGLPFGWLFLLIAVGLCLLVQLPVSVLMVVGGLRMRRLQSHGLAVLASLLALLPCQPLFLLGLIAGIWSLIVLNRPHIKGAFAEQANRLAGRGPSGTRGTEGAHSSAWHGRPLTQIRFVVDEACDVVPQAIFHFSALGYELIERQPDACTFQRGRKMGGLWSTDIRQLHTRLTVRTATAAIGQQWVSCDWSVRTLGSWITRRDIETLESEGYELEAMLAQSGPAETKLAVKATDGQSSKGEAWGGANANRNEIEQLVVDSLRHGKIEAIRTYRKATGAHLAEAKDAVETIAKLHGIRMESNLHLKRLWQIALPAAAFAGLCALAANGQASEIVKGIGIVSGAVVLLLYYFGLWAAIRRERASEDDQSGENGSEVAPHRSPANSLTRAGTAMLFAGVLNCASPVLLIFGAYLVWLLIIWFTSAADGRPPAFGQLGIGAPESALLLLSVATGVAMIAAGVHMRQRHSRRIAMAGSVLALLPCSLCWLINAPIALWSLLVLSNQDRRNEFSRDTATANSELKNSHALRRTILFGIAALLLCALVVTATLAYFSRQKSNASKELPIAARAGDVKRVKALLSRGADVEAKDEHGNPAIVAAAIGGDNEVIQLLVQRGANINARDAQGETALMEAAFNGHYAAAEELLFCQADVGIKDRHGQTALYWAVAGGNPEIVGKLLPHVAWDAFGEKDAQGNPLLTVAAIRGNAAMIKKLLSVSPDVDVRDAQGETPLMEAAYNGHVTAVEELLRASVKPNILARDNAGATALDWAVARGQEAVVQRLLAQGAEETGAYHLWRGCQAGTAGNFAEGITKLTKAVDMLASVTRRVVFQVNDERYITQHPHALALAMLASCELHAGQPDEARKHFELLKAHVAGGSLPLFTWVKLSPKANTTGEFDPDNHTTIEHTLSADALAAAIARPQLVHLSFHRRKVATSGAPGMTSRSEESFSGTTDFFFRGPASP